MIPGAPSEVRVEWFGTNGQVHRKDTIGMEETHED
jgi:hypothetical protein